MSDQDDIQILSIKIKEAEANILSMKRSRS